MADLRPGQKLLFVSMGIRARVREVEVERVGRTWMTLVGMRGRIDKHTLKSDVDRRGLYGRCFLSQEDYERTIAEEKRKREAESAWDALCRKMPPAYRKPPGMTIEAIREVARLCGVELGDKSDG